MRPYCAAAALVLAAAAARAGELDRFPETGPPPVRIPHFPRPLDAFVFRNWGVVPLQAMARAIDAPPEALSALAETLGLGFTGHVPNDIVLEKKMALTAIRRNWHLLPYEQLLRLLGWSEEKLAFHLREDDFLWIKLGRLKPTCPKLRWEPIEESSRARYAEIRRIVEGLGGRTFVFATPMQFLYPLENMNEYPPSRLPGDALEGEVSLDGPVNWLLPPGASPDVKSSELFHAVNFANRFLQQSMKAPGPRSYLDSPASDPIPGGLPLKLLLDPQGFGEPESHEIAVAEKEVIVRAGGISGLARGVFRLLDRIEERGGPFLEPGVERRDVRFGLRLLFPYTGRHSEPFLDTTISQGYFEKISRLGVNALWLPAILDRFDEADPNCGRRLEKLRSEALLGALHGVRIFLYLNEPRAKPSAWFEGRPGERGVAEGAFHARCTSSPETREWMSRIVERIAREVPELGGFFTISMSENLTSCWSHGGGKGCARCSVRPGPEVVAEANRALFEGARRGNPKARFIAWDWGWPDDWIPAIVEALPPGIDLMSVSEWGVPIERGGVKTTVGEYSISAPGPGQRARRTWELARRSGRRAVAKIQANITWELSAVPYIPVPGLVAGHVDRLARENVDDLMLGWTLGGWPSPNLQVAAEWFFGPAPPVDAALDRVARRRFGKAGPSVVKAWAEMGEAFSHFPFHGVLVYNAPLQLGPANLLHASPTGYRATMTGLPYDDLDGWRAVYPRDAYVKSLEAVAEGWAAAPDRIPDDPALSPRARLLLGEEKDVALAAQLHFQSAWRQGEFVRARDALAGNEGDPNALLDRLEVSVKDELESARRLLEILRKDSRIGYEPSNQYYYRPVDLMEKVINCRWILDDWIPGERRKRA